MSLLLILVPNTPRRGPRMTVPTNPQVPPSKCTTPAPAKSLKPMTLSQPPPHTQAAATGYMKPVIRKAKNMYVSTKVRSARLPATMVGILEHTEY